jgi:diguanylate cyclase
MTDDSQDQEKWKYKYLETLEDLERKENSWQLADQSLRRGLGRVALISQGIDDNLDRHLNELRKALQKEAEANVLEQVIDKISRYLKTLDEKRETENGRETLEPTEVLVRIIESINFSGDARSKASQLKKLLKKAEAPDQFDVLLGHFTKLIEESFYGDKAERPASFDRPPSETVLPDRAELEPAAAQRQQPQQQEKQGWFKRMFSGGGSSAPEEIIDLGDSDSAPEVHEVREIQEQQFQTPSAKMSEPGQAVVGSTSVASASGVEDVFLELLECLVFPPQFNERVQQLKETLTKGLKADSVKLVTDGVVNLIVDIHSALESEKEELEMFLQQLTQRLQELDAMVEGAETNRLASLTSTRQLNEMVNAQVNDIENVVQDSSDVDNMKLSIKDSLENIRLHLAEQREQEESRQEDLEQQLKAMTEKLNVMEGESQNLKQRLEKEREQAMTDALTGAPNRLAYDKRITQEFARWERYDSPLTMIVCDVDHFKNINDTYGHKAGDRALIAIVKTIQQHLRETDFMARIGGEEFVVLLPETTMGDAQIAAEKLRGSLEDCEFVFQGTPVSITMSGGLAQFQPGNTVDAVYQRADKALYRAKNSGRNQFLSAQ